MGPVLAASLFWKFVALRSSLSRPRRPPTVVKANLFYTLRLDDLVYLYGRVFGRKLSCEGAKASPYSRYYVAVNTPHLWKYAMTVLGGSLARLGKLEDGTAESASISVYPPSVLIVFGSSQNVRDERPAALG
ncbi:hypothetical protein BGW80DRAFT_1256359 [Lactifluus volemus]|nr:hypothetical protein BGW80DRAFT_1256359 [Lactifluus volemus]